MPLNVKRRLLVPDRSLLLPPARQRRFLPDGRFPHIWVPRAVPETASVGFDASGYKQNTGASVSSVSQSFTIGSALSNGALIGVLGYTGTTAPTGVTMTWNGVSMTLIGNSANDSTGAMLFFFGLVNPAGGTNTLASSWTTASTATIGFWSFSGVDQTGGATTFLNFTSSLGTGSQITRTATVTTVAGYATVGCWAVGQDFSGTQTPAADWKQNAGSFTFPNMEGQHVLSTGTSDSYTCTIAVSDTIDFAGCAIKAAAGGGPVFIARPNGPILQAVKRASYW